MTWIVISPKGYIYYEGIDKADCQRNCPNGYIIKLVDDSFFN